LSERDLPRQSRGKRGQTGRNAVPWPCLSARTTTRPCDDERTATASRHVVDRRLAKRPASVRKGGRPRHRAPPFEGFHERRFFAQDETARASPDFHVYRKVAGKDAIARETPPKGVLDGAGHSLGGKMRLAVYVEIDARRARRLRREQRALE
jgi:hypothetical protein